MTKAGVARLKAQLSRYLDIARRGQEVVVSERMPTRASSD